MPKSKRAKLVSLTQTKRKSTRERKTQLMEEIRQCVDTYKNLFVFDINNMRSRHMKEIRTRLRDDARFFLTKNKVMILALGREKQDEHAENLSQVSNHIYGLCGLLFTNKNAEEIQALFKQYRVRDYAKAGFVPEEDISLEAGIVEWMPHSLEERLVRLGLNIDVQNGKINLRQDFQVCKTGEALTPTQAKILKHFGMEISEFNIRLRCLYSKGKLTELLAIPKSISELPKKKKLAAPTTKKTATTTATTSEDMDDDDDEEEEDDE